MESVTEITPYQREGVINRLVCNQAPVCCWTICIDLFRQYHYAFVRKKVWGDYFIKLIGDFRKAMVSLPGDQYPTTSHIYTINDEPCRCPVTPDSPDRMVNLVTKICSTRRCLCSTRCRSVCFSGERQGIKLLQLVSRHC
ncbi:hypothetical protein AYI70_g7055, partial [Smittium culicis]